MSDENHLFLIICPSDKSPDDFFKEVLRTGTEAELFTVVTATPATHRRAILGGEVDLMPNLGIGVSRWPTPQAKSPRAKAPAVDEVKRIEIEARVKAELAADPNKVYDKRTAEGRIAASLRAAAAETAKIAEKSVAGK